MKKIFLLLTLIYLFIPIFLFSFKKPAKIDPKKNYTNIAMEAWKKKDFSEAAKNMRYSYFQKADSYRLFWYTYFLYLAKDYKEMVDMLQIAPKEHWISKHYGTGVYRHYAFALKELKRYKESTKVFIETIKRNDKYMGHNFFHLIRYDWRVPNLLAYEFKLNPDYLPIMKKMIDYYNKNLNKHKFIANTLFWSLSCYL